MTLLDDFFQRFGITADDLRGAEVRAEIPLTNAVVNRFIAEQLAKRQTPLVGVQTEALADDSCATQLVAKTRMIPPMTVFTRIERQPEFPSDPVLWLRWSMPGMGALSLLAGPAVRFFKTAIERKLPPGISLHGERVAIDVPRLLAERGFGDLVGYIAGLRVRTRPGAFLVQVEMKA